jgi:uncharacterized membrane protein
MSDLVCLAFNDVDMADHFLNELRGLEKEHVLELEDACVVVRDGDGKIHLKQSVNLVAIGATRGASFGMLMGTRHLVYEPAGRFAGRRPLRCVVRRPEREAHGLRIE